MKIFLLTSTIIGCFIIHPAIAQDGDLDELLDLSLEELTVSVASKRDEKISEAPGIISLVSKDDIRSFGGRTLGDVLNRLPGVTVSQCRTQ